MTHHLNRAIGAIQETTKDWSAALCRYSHDCRRYAIKYGWSADYEEAAWRWGVTRAAREVMRLKARHERIAYPLRFVLAKMHHSLLRDESGMLFIPRYRVERRLGNGTEVTFSDLPFEVEGGVTHEAR